MFAVFLYLLGGLGSCGGSDKAVDLTAASPRELAEAVSFSGVHSGELEIALGIDNQGEDGKADVRMRLLGKFMRAGEVNPPEFDIALESDGRRAGRKFRFSSGLSLLGDRAVVFDAPSTYQPDRSTFEVLRSKYEDAQRPDSAGNAMACVEALQGLEVGNLIGRASDNGSREEPDGTQVIWVEAELDVPVAFDALLQMAEDKACGAQLRAVGVPAAAQLGIFAGAAEKMIDQAHVLFTVDRRGVPREVSVEITAKGTAGKELMSAFHYRLTRVNEVTELPMPNGSARFSALLKRFGTTLPAVQIADGRELLGGFLEAIGKSLTGRQ